MASIRRTLSPVPRQGISLSGEVCSVASPLSKSSSCTQTYPSATSRVLSSVLGLTDQAFLFEVFSPRSTRSLDRSKQKGPIWRKAVIHFFMCFLIGVFIGFTPFSSMTFAMYPITKYEVFSRNIASDVRNSQVDDAETGKEILISDTEGIKENATAELLVDKPESGNGVSSDDISSNLILVQESNVVPGKLLIIVTPTYAWPFQKYYLNRLAQTLKLVQPPLLWIVVEMTSQSVEIAEILRRTRVMYRHLVCNKNLTDIKDRNVDLRNAALAHIETHHLDGIVYFADDSNVYSINLFEHMRQIRRSGTWKVAKLSRNMDKAVAEGPVCNGTQVIGWNTEQANRRNRRFHAEISGFAFNSTILWDPKRWHRPTMEPIRQSDSVEDDSKTSAFMEQIVEDESQMEGLPQDCSKIMVWQLSLEPMSFITIDEHTVLYDLLKPI